MILLRIDRLLAGYDSRYRWKLALILALAAIQTVLVVLRPIPVKFLVDQPEPGSFLAGLHDWAGGPQGYLIGFAVLIFLIEGAILIFRIWSENRSTRLSETLMRRIRGDVAANLLQGPYERVSQIGVGRVLAAVVGDVQTIQLLIKEVVVAASISALQLALMLTVVFFLQPALFFILLVEIALLAVLIAVYANWRKRVFLAQMQTQERYLNWVSNLYSKNLDLRFGQARNLFLQRTLGLGRALFRSSNRIWRAHSTYQALIEFFLGLASAVCLVFLFLESTGSGKPIGDLLVFLYYTVLVFPCLSKVGEAVPLMTDGSNAYSRLAPLIGLADAVERRAPGASVPRFGAIEFQDVGFRTAQGEWIVRNLDFTIQPGERVALFGDSGAGKSTIFGMLLGLIQPSEGRILVDGRPTTDLSLADRKRLFLFQRSTAPFFNGTVQENVTLGRDIGPDAAAALADDVFLARRLAASEEGWQTSMGERGEPFSQGEQQRIAMARVFLTDRPCVIMDEALNSLDEATEIAIVEKLLARVHGRTLLIITHRRSVAERVDKFFYLRKGGRLEISERAANLRTD